MKRSYLTYLSAFLAMLIIAGPATLFAKDQAAPKREIVPLHYNIKLSLPIMAIAGVGWVTMEGIQEDIAPENCRWCSVNDFDAWGHSVFKISDTGAANTASHFMAYGAAPLSAFGITALAAYHDGQLKNFATDALIIAEAVAVSSFLTQIVKVSVGRQRPAAHYGEGSTGRKSNTSFYSGHTNLAFTLAVASGTVASMRKYRLAPLIWGVGMAAATTTAYLRVAANKHYLSDVLTAAAIGSTIGFVMPYFMHKPRKNKMRTTQITAMPVKGGAMLGLTGSL